MQRIRDDIYLGNNNASLCNIGYILSLIAKNNNEVFIWWVKKPSTCVCQKDEYESNLIWHEDNALPKPTWYEIYKMYLDICNSKCIKP